VHLLFADRCDVAEIACRDALETNARFKQRGLTALDECAYLVRRAAPGR
jgi:hypothetical protein